MLLTVWFYFFLVFSTIIASIWVILATIVNPQIEFSINDHPSLGHFFSKKCWDKIGSSRPGEFGTWSSRTSMRPIIRAPLIFSCCWPCCRQ